MTPAKTRTIPAQAVDPETKPFWDAAAEGRLLIKRCRACGEPHYYPRSLCPFCFGETEWEETSGRGVIYTFSIMRRGPDAPFAIGYVTLDEGLSVLTNITGCDLDALRIGQPVRVVFQPTEGGPPVPMFTPTE